MKAENLKRAQEIVGILVGLEARLKFLDNSHTEINIGLYHSQFGGQGIDAKYLTTGLQGTIKVLVLAEIKSCIGNLKAELETL